MTNTEIIQAIRAEIEMRIKECEATYPKDKGGYWFPEQEEAYAIAEEYKQLLSFLGTLEDGASEKQNNHMEIVNDLTSEVPTRAVQLPDGRWVTEEFANNNCIYGRKPEERHCEYCSANCSTGHDFQRAKGLDEAANAYSNEHNDDCFDAIGSVCPHIIEAFIAGAKWQADHAPLPEDTVLFNKGVEEGKRLMIEDYPKWHKVQRGSCFDKHTNFILSAREGHFYCSSMEVQRDGYILLVDELERLPKEDEK